MDNEAVLRRMGLNKATPRSADAIAKTLRKGNGGAFGKLGEEDRKKRGDFR